MPLDSHVVGCVIDGLWLVFAIYWLAHAVGNKRTVYRQSQISRVVFLMSRKRGVEEKSAQWGGPAALGADPQAAAKLRGFGGRYLTDAKIAALIESARTSGGVPTNAWEAIEFKELAGRIVEQRKEVALCRRRLRRLTRGHQTIESMAPAVGLTTACVLWACLGDPRQYDSAAAYRKAMGLNLVERSSGAFKGRLRLSKRGQRLARKWMYLSALRWMRDSSVKPWVRRKKN